MLKLDKNWRPFDVAFIKDLHLGVADIWEHVNFHIEDYENGSINFYCVTMVVEF